MKEDNPEIEDEMDLVEALFCKALGMDCAEERDAFLERECGGDNERRAVVERLLAKHVETEDFFCRSMPAGLSAVEVSNTLSKLPDFFEKIGSVHADDDEVGKQIGPYRLLQKIGEGGSGNVYLAEQSKPVRRQVALKIIKLGMDTKNVIARFEAERQTLAMMEHPNIAHVLGAGETETGRPFFVMELVHGVKITTYCDEARLDIRQRLKLFVTVCRAIQHAHQKGIIHRDIKPSNVLITQLDELAMPVVIDFGIAKATGESLLSDETVFTAIEPFIGTPAYMSPEQAQMKMLDIDTRSDIYSLGVLLYELLAGRPPFDQKELMASGLDGMRRILSDREPCRPEAMLRCLEAEEQGRIADCRSTKPHRLAMALDGDLDCIVLKALEKERSRRYETADAFAMDVERFLHDEPVMARPPSRLYRFRKLARRNKVVFASGAAVLLALIAGFAASTWMFFKAEKARANEAALRVQAESREVLTEAVMLVNQGDYAGAAQLIETMKVQPTRPSLDGVAALRSVGEWLALQGRWRESADRYLTLMEIDKLDPWGAVTLDYQSCGVVLVESGKLAEYERFREEAVARFSNEENGDAAGRILKTCLLPPVHEGTVAQLRPLGVRVEQWFEAQPTVIRQGWAAIPIALWKYREGEFAKAEEYGRWGLDATDTTAKGATIQTILAMSCHRIGNASEAREHLARGRAMVEEQFVRGLDRGAPAIGMWYDWVFARILLREASELIGPAPLGAP
jgi:hypothetical protein